jgi:hypothetical protein
MLWDGYMSTVQGRGFCSSSSSHMLAASVTCHCLIGAGCGVPGLRIQQRGSRSDIPSSNSITTVTVSCSYRCKHLSTVQAGTGAYSGHQLLQAAFLLYTCQAVN